MAKPKGYKCVLGEYIAKPNSLIYFQQISEKDKNIWVGWCSGDKSHEEHFVKIVEKNKKSVLRRDKNPFRSPQKDLSKRLFERQKLLRCPKGKVYMKLQKRMTGAQPFDNLDMYRCTGNLKGKGHRPHYVKISHGETDFSVNHKKVKVLIVTIES